MKPERRLRRIVRRAVVALAVVVIAAGIWRMREGAAEAAHRKDWEERAKKFHVPVYPSRPVRLPLPLPIPRQWIPERRETVVQVERETDLGNLMRFGLADYPDGLVIMEIGLSESNRRLLQERYPKALIVPHPNMPP